MSGTVDIDEAFERMNHRLQATEIVVGLVVHTLEENGVLKKGEVNSKIHQLLKIVEQDTSTSAQETAKWLRTLYGQDRPAAEIIEFPDKKS